MIIEKLILDNFRSLDNLEIDFKKGINVLDCPNGWGKTSIILSIVYSIFDLIPKSDGTNYKLEDLINWNTKKDYFNIEITFNHLGNSFYQNIRYEKSGKTGKTSRMLKINDKEEYTNSEAVKKLNELFDPDLLKPAMLYVQKSFGIIETSPSKRRDYFKKIFNLEFTEAIKDLDNENDSIEKKIIDLDKIIYLLQNKKYEKKNFINLPFSEKEYDSRILNIKDIKNNILSLEMKLSSIERDKKDRLQLEKNISDKNIASINLNNKLKNTKQLLDTHENELYQDFEKNLKQLKNNLELLNDEEIKKLEEELLNIKLVRVLTFDESKLENIIKNYYEKTSELKQLEIDLDKLKSGLCPTCKKDFNSNDLDTWNKDIVKIKLEIKNIEELKNKLIEEKNKIESDRKENDNNKNKRNLIQSKIDKEKQYYEITKNTLEKDIKNEEKNIEDKKNNILNNIKSYQDIVSSYEKELADLNEEIIKLNNDYNSLPVIQDDSIIKTELSMLNNNVLNIDKELKEYDKILILNNSFKLHNENIEKDMLLDSSELKINLEKKDNLLSEQNTIKESKVILQKTFPNYVIKELISNVEKEMNVFIESIYRKMNVKFKEVKDAINIVYDEAEKDVNLCSGFEKEFLSTAFMTSLSKLQNNDLLILDEMDASASDENSIKLYDLLQNVDNYNQMIIITHREEVKKLLSENANIIKKE